MQRRVYDLHRVHGEIRKKMIQDTWLKTPDPLYFLEGPPPIPEKIGGKAIEKGFLSSQAWPFGYIFLLTDRGDLIYRVDYIPEECLDGWIKAVSE